MDNYAASCNPPRRAKRPRGEESSASIQKAPSSQLPPRAVTSALAVPILPKQSTTTPATSASSHSSVETTNNPATASNPTPSRRGRKPGPLSRSAREAQRKLNHSIIEKARRTKINEALATLRQLVPADYNGHKSKEKEKDSDDDDGDYEEDAKKKKSKGTGKREEKEKEFKLEILVRTVAYMQELLGRVDELERGAPQSCSNCVKKQSSKRKRVDTDEEIDDEDTIAAHREMLSASRTSASPQHLPLGSPALSAVMTKPSSTASPRQTISPDPPSRLPSISSWLPDSQIDPRLLPSSAILPPISSVSHLPSPPSSTRFDPVRSSQAPPTLALGPVATSALLTPPQRTPEDESAASLLLQIASSPTLSPTFTGPVPPDAAFSLQRSATKSELSPLQTKYSMQVQTPSSLLGLGRIN